MESVARGAESIDCGHGSTAGDDDDARTHRDIAIHIHTYTYIYRSVFSHFLLR